MTLYLLFIDKTKILNVYNVLLMYPINNIQIKQLNDNCIDIVTDLSEKHLNDIIKDYLYKIGYYNTFLIMDTSFDFEVIM